MGWGFDEEALRVVKAMPNWKPGKQNGKPVRVLFTLPIVFKI
jgi:protein TonB